MYEFHQNMFAFNKSSSCPKYSTTYAFGVVNVVNTQEWTIWVMDDGMQSLMMFPEER